MSETTARDSRGAHFVATVPAGTRLITCKGRVFVARPGLPPAFIDVDGALVELEPQWDFVDLVSLLALWREKARQCEASAKGLPDGSPGQRYFMGLEEAWLQAAGALEATLTH